MSKICKSMNEEQARHNVNAVIEAATVSLALIADKSGSEYAREMAGKLAELHVERVQHDLEDMLLKALGVEEEGEL